MSAETILPFSHMRENTWESSKIVVIGESEINCKNLLAIRDLFRGEEPVIVAMSETDLAEGSRGYAKADILLSLGADRVVSCTFEEVAYLLSGEYGNINQVGSIVFQREDLVMGSVGDTLPARFEETSDQFDVEMVGLARKAIKDSNCWLDPAGCVFVRDDEVLLTSVSTSFNGSSCEDLSIDHKELTLNPGERMRFCDSLHAERVGTTKAARDGVSLDGSTIYLTKFPCRSCMQEIINAGIVKVVFEEGSYGLADIGLLTDNSISVVRALIK